MVHIYSFIYFNQEVIHIISQTLFHTRAMYVSFTEK